MGKIDADIEYLATIILRITSIHIFYSMIKILFFPATKHEQKVFSNTIVQQDQDQGTNRMMIKETCDLSGLGALSGYSSIPDRMRIQISVVK
jgi:hypothetical protein